MEFLSDMPLWLTATMIFGFRVLDVSLGTVRTIAVIHGRIRASVVLGFLEILIWVTAISQVVANLGQSPLLLLAYAGGFAAGNATGILLERRLAWGTVIVRLISIHATAGIVSQLRSRGHWAAVFKGEGASGDELLIFTTCTKSSLRSTLEAVRKLDPGVVYSVEPVLESGPVMRQPLPHQTGWQGRYLRK